MKTENWRITMMRRYTLESGAATPKQQRLSNDLLEKYGEDLTITDARLNDVVWQHNGAAEFAEIFQDIDYLMNLIGDFLRLSYEFDHNPLPHLECLFNSFKWSRITDPLACDEILRNHQPGQRIFSVAGGLVVAHQHNGTETHIWPPMST